MSALSRFEEQPTYDFLRLFDLIALPGGVKDE
jgi:hypothetical protein